MSNLTIIFRSAFTAFVLIILFNTNSIANLYYDTNAKTITVLGSSYMLYADLIVPDDYTLIVPLNATLSVKGNLSLSEGAQLQIADLGGLKVFKNLSLDGNNTLNIGNGTNNQAYLVVGLDLDIKGEHNHFNCQNMSVAYIMGDITNSDGTSSNEVSKSTSGNGDLWSDRTDAFDISPGNYGEHNQTIIDAKIEINDLLSVELISLSAEIKETYQEINWSTAVEQNASHFEIYSLLIVKHGSF